MTSLVTSAAERFVVGLDDPVARRPEQSGAKAASLAITRGAGIAVLPGFVVTTAGHAEFIRAGHRLPAALERQLRDRWASLSQDGSVALVVRSSSTVEDIAASSMAGRFRTVLDVQGWPAFREALVSVFRSAAEVTVGSGPSPMGVLVQRFLAASRGGVLFGIDPVTGDGRHIVVEAVAGGPDRLVSGRVSAQRYVLARRGRLLTVDHRPYHLLSVNHHGERLLGNRELRALARLAGRTQEAFGGPQDVEWAFDEAGCLLLLQSRPVTATGVTVEAAGPVLGPGPVAETFPDPLGPLETDLWITPLRHGVTAALRETRAVADSALRSSPVVTTVHGRAAADLELFGYVPTRPAMAALDPRPRLRRLAAAWHVGKLRAVLPSRAGALIDDVDERLTAVDLGGAGDDEILSLLDSCTALLERLHHEEVLAGTLLPAVTRTATSVALTTLAEHRGEEPDDHALVRRHPILLSLVPPSITTPMTLPPATAVTRRTGRDVQGELDVRERVRLRVRWVQELTARAALELGRRLAARGVLDDADSIALLDRACLTAVVGTGRVLDMHARRAEAVAAAFSPPLPAQFRLTRSGQVVPSARTGARPAAGVGAGGGRGTGPAVHGSVRNPPAPGDVLVVRELQPGLAASLPGLAGLVAETGSTLSHLAILAREYGVPTVVAVHDAVRRFPQGTQLVVDGSTGDVSTLDGVEMR
ncbi:MAG TPA: PEP/pyruvate-binding domain-containing protein [Jiangellaceae bacterium]